MMIDKKELIKKCIGYIIVVLIVFILVFLIIILTPNNNTRSIDRCYEIIEQENITKEYLEDTLYHAYVNNTLVCAHGFVNPEGLKEEIVYIPFPSIRVVNLT